MRKKVITIIMSIIMFVVCISPVTAYEYDSDKVTVYVTVNDITDADNPLDTIYERQPLTVTNFDMSQYGEEFNGIQILDSGVTYLHVLIALHEQLYGKADVENKLKIDSGGVTRIFMGRSVGSIMYKNGNYIFAIPQYVNVRNGDEVNICLYDEGYNQAIASFSQAYVNAAEGETVNLNLFTHHWYPENTENISGAELVDENGIYMTDADGNIITTDEDGNFSLTFPKAGLYKVTIMPTLGYYMASGGGTWLVWWEEETVPADYDSTTAMGKAIDALLADNSILNIDVVDWSAFRSIDELSTIEGYTHTETNTPNQYKPTIRQITVNDTTQTVSTTYKTPAHTELVEHRQFVSGEAKQKVDYTTPWTIVNVTDKFMITGVTKNSKQIYITTLNSSAYTGNLMCAGYDEDENGELLFKELRFANNNMFNFTADHDCYKVFAWESGMSPACAAYFYDNRSAANVLQWNLTMPKPDNVITTGGGDGE